MSAKPNAKLPSAKPSSFSVRRLLSVFCRSSVISGLAHRHDDERCIEPERDQPEHDGGTTRFGAPLADLLGSHRAVDRRIAHQCSAPRAITSRDGGCVQLWYGGGEESSHSRPRAPSQARAPTFWPPFTHFQMMYGNSS